MSDCRRPGWIHSGMSKELQKRAYLLSLLAIAPVRWSELKIAA